MNLNRLGILNHIDEIIITQIHIMRTLHNKFRIEEIIITQLQFIRTLHSEFTRQLTDRKLKMMHPIQQNKPIAN
jgi:hypothetical protein